MSELDLDAIERRIEKLRHHHMCGVAITINLVAMHDAPALVARVRELEAENEALVKMIPAEAWISDRELTPEEYEFGAQVPIPDEIKEALK